MWRSSSNIVLDDGTAVGSTSDAGRAFAEAIQRMHCIFRDCDAEFRVLSEAANANGRGSEQFKEAARQLQACQRRARGPCPHRHASPGRNRPTATLHQAPGSLA